MILILAMLLIIGGVVGLLVIAARPNPAIDDESTHPTPESKPRWGEIDRTRADRRP